MNKYKLTKDIIDELASKINKSPINGKSYKPVSKKDSSSIGFKKHHILVIFTGTNIRLDEVFSELSEIQEYGFTFDIALSPSGSDVIEVEKIKKKLNPKNIYTEEDISKFDKILKNSDALIVPMATQDIVVKLSLGIQDNFISTLLWQALWIGKSLLIDFESAITPLGRKSNNPILENMIDEYIQKLSKMGVKKLTKNGYLVGIKSLFSQTDINDLEEDFQQINQTKDKKVIITEKDILNMSPHRKEITVPLRAIITPLAYDTAKKLGIKIDKK